MEQNKPYSVLQNVCYILMNTWRLQRQLLMWCGLSIAATMLLPLVTMYLPKAVICELETAASIRTLVLTVLGFTAAMAALSGLSAWADNMIECYSLEMRLERSRLLDRKAYTADYEYFDTASFMAGRSKAQNAVMNDRAAFAGVYPCMVKLCAGALGFTAYLTILLHLGWWVAPVTGLCAVASSVQRLRSNRRRNAGRDTWWTYNKKMEYINERATEARSSKDIRLFGIADWFHDVFDAQLRLFANWDKSMEDGLLLADLVDCGLTICREGVAYGVLISMVLSKSITASDFVLYFAAVGGFSTWVSTLFSQFTELHRHSLDISDYRRHVEHPDSFRRGNGVTAEEFLKEPNEICLEDVSYRYPGSGDWAVRHLSLTIHPGEKIAVVGLNGAGKTTLVKLLCGLIEPTEGAVYYGGIDIRDFDRDEYYRLFSAVFQDFCTLPLSVAENIAGNSIDEDRVRDCLKEAGLLEKVESLPNGLHTRMLREVHEDAAELSGGETQRLMLARAIYKQAPVVVLDEPTAALDPIAENEIYQKYSHLTEGRSSLYISHRLASTRFCDRVLYLENGQIAEQGSHDSLMAQRGKYYELFEIQSQYYRNGKEASDL